MIIEIQVPSPGESITEVEIASWMVADGDIVEVDQEIAEIESDKATLTLNSTANGRIKILAEAGQTIAVGAVACSVDTEAAGEASAAPVKTEAPKTETPKTTPASEAKTETTAATEKKKEHEHIKVSPVAQKLMDEQGLDLDAILAGLQRIGRREVEAALAAPQEEQKASTPKVSFTSAAPEAREEKREKMTQLRKKLSERLVSVKNETAMLTTFNEIDMSYVMDLRNKYQKKFVDKHGIKVGFMSFFTKAVTEALRLHPMVNAQIVGDEIVSFNYADVGIAVQTPKGLMVPVIRDADKMSLAEIELKIKELAEKARTRKISIDELSGGTFTITNGGTFGSLMSTPIINPPQSAILGMHNIVERPIAVNGQIVIRPMMYVALSYDHRIIDGKDSVGFLVKVKEMIENPQRMLFGGTSPEEILLGL